MEINAEGVGSDHGHAMVDTTLTGLKKKLNH
jgi:hypothetical protein